ncbi:MAG TPA: hypothetical protein VMV19_18165 [Xanthobacteraceae bacterium]|nr:hypothetical protein [Xanthobacteraceae bacterium]
MAFEQPATIRKILDIIASRPNLSAAARACGIKERTLFDWLAKADAGDQKFFTRWPADEDDSTAPLISFVDAVSLARKRNVLLFEHQIRDQAMHGRERLVVVDGAQKYQQDEQWIGVDDKTMIALGFEPPEWWRLKRDEFKRPIPMTIIDPPAAHLQIKAAASLMPATWGDRQHIVADVRHSGGVVVVGQKSVQRMLQQRRPPKEGQDEISATLEHLDTLPDTEMVRDMRRQLNERRMRGPTKPTHPVFVGGRNDGPADDGTRPGASARPTAQPYRSPEERSEGVGRGPTAEQLSARGGASVMQHRNPVPQPTRIGADGYPEYDQGNANPSGHVAFDPQVPKVSKVTKMV